MRSNAKRQTRRAGFTLVELLLVITIIGILAGAVVVKFRGVAGKAKENRAKADIAALEVAITSFEIDTGDIPSNEEGLEALVEDPGLDGWRSGGYLTKKNFNDPWSEEYIYRSPGERNDDYDLFSMGKDKQEGTEDDIGNWEDEDDY